MINNIFSQQNARGQLFSSDALLSIVIFLFVMSVISTVGQQLQNQSSDELQNYRITQRAERVAQTLFLTPGYPAGWEYLPNRNSVSSVGVSKIGAVVSPQKWSAFLDWNATEYSDLANHLGIGDLNFYIMILDVNKNTLTQVGISPVDKNQVSVVTLPVVYSSTAAIAIVQVYGG